MLEKDYGEGRLDLERERNEAQRKRDNLKNVLLFMIFLAIVFGSVLNAFHCPCTCHVKGYELDKYVKDQDGNPLVGATVILYNHPNGMVVAQGETDEHGWYNFTNIQYGHYFLWVSYGGVISSEWIWLTEDKEITNTLTLPTEGQVCGEGEI